MGRKEILTKGIEKRITMMCFQNINERKEDGDKSEVVIYKMRHINKPNYKKGI